LPNNHANKNHQQDGERDANPLAHDGSLTPSGPEIEKTRAAVAPDQSGMATV
jgi:hypothetical protein